MSLERITKRRDASCRLLALLAALVMGGTVAPTAQLGLRKSAARSPGQASVAQQERAPHALRDASWPSDRDDVADADDAGNAADESEGSPQSVAPTRGEQGAAALPQSAASFTCATSLASRSAERARLAQAPSAAPTKTWARAYSSAHVANTVALGTNVRRLL